MKRAMFFYTWVFISLLLCTNLLEAEGFLAGTVVYTTEGIKPIEQICVKDSIVGDDQIKLSLVLDTVCNVVDYYIKIYAEDVVVCSACDQKFYVSNKNRWISAVELDISDELLCCDGKIVCVHAIEVVHEFQKMYTLSVDINHIFCVTHYRIIAHNVEPVCGTAIVVTLSFVCPPAAVGLAIGEIIAFGIAGLGIYFMGNKIQKNTQDRFFVQSNNFNCSGKPPKHEKDDEEHPHGIYEDAPYHHPNSSGSKSMSPKNGQKCLDESFSVGDKSNRRISIEDDMFVILEQTSPGKFHGYVVKTWDELNRSGASREMVRKAFRSNGLVNKAGKIIKRVL
ncbi:MAG TPA: polymorphic toxin-type HINT domain-containing protein [Candidatus Babeliales bacterium]|jgi:hypothetical protein|nr:polymorphic toxin-type HINT domain-containing protein [Candidatus Babeliales bacterium]